MSWIVSLILAGAMLAGEADLPLQTKNAYVETNAKQIVRLDETERFEQTYPLTPNGRVSVSNVNGPITIEAWDRNEVRLEAVKTAEKREYLQDIEIRIDARPDSLRVETDYDGLKRRTGGQWKNYGKLEVAYRLSVPRGAVLDEIEAVNGSVTVSNMTNITKVSAVNGQVKATNLRGTAVLETVNGVVEADFNALERGSQISLSTVNGQANLLIPSDADATIKADSVNGSIINDFGLPVRKGQYVGRDLYGRVGTGDVRIKLESVNGELSIRRRQDGKAVKPATNLLSQKTDDDKFGAEISATAKKAVRESVKVAAAESVRAIVDESVRATTRQAMEEARRAIEESRKELSKVKIDSKELKARIKEGQLRQIETLEKLREAGWLNASPVIDKKSESFAVKGTPKVTIDAKNCLIVVRGWDKSEVRYSVTKYSRFRNSAPVQYKADHNDREVTIRVTETDAPEREYFPNELNRIRIEVFVPKKSNLRILTNREIRVEGVSGEVDLQGGDESVNVRDVDGKLSVRTSDGRIRVVGFRGALDAKTGDGTMHLEGDFQSFNARASEGTIVLTLPDDANAVLQANAEIENAGLNLIREDDDAKVWRIGSGGVTYRMNVDEGKIVVRSAGEIKPNSQ